MYVTVSFAIPPKGLVQVPAAAVLYRSSGPQVARVDRDGKITFRKVSIARDDGNVIELGSGAEAGDELALNVSSQISEGELVQISHADAQAPAGGLPVKVAASP